MKLLACRRNRRGSVLTLAPVLIALLCVMAAFTVDLGYMYVIRSQLQSAADAAALAGAIELRDSDLAAFARKSAIEFAELNEPGHGKVLHNRDFETGEWNFQDNTFVATIFDPNAVRATVRRDGSHANSVPLFFAAIFGQKDFKPAATATAAFTVETDDQGDQVKGMPSLVE